MCGSGQEEGGGLSRETHLGLCISGKTSNCLPMNEVGLTLFRSIRFETREKLAMDHSFKLHRKKVENFNVKNKTTNILRKYIGYYIYNL